MKTYKKSNKKIIFILCAGRSGSTLLKNMLDQHTDIFAPAELNILPFDSLDDMELNFRNTSLSKGLIEAIIKLRKCTESQALEIYEDFKKQNFSSQDIYDWFLSQIKETFLVDKSPTYCIHSTALNCCQKLNNEVRYIHLVRHPLAVMKSILENKFDKLARLLKVNSFRALNSKTEAPTSNFLFFDRMAKTKHAGVIAESMWRDANQNISHFLEGIDQEQKTEIYYESLVEQPVQTMKKICSFLNIEYEEDMNKTKGIFSNVEETVGDPNFFKRNNIKNLNAFSLEELTDDKWQIDPATIALAIKYKYLCWESEKTMDLLPTETQFFENNSYYNDHCLVTSFEADYVERFDQRRLSRSLAELMIKNPNLSSVFIAYNKEWKRKLIRDAQIQITRIFCNPEEDSNRYLDAYSNLWIKGLDISKGPLLSIFYVYQNKKLTIRYVIHHLLMDGSAMLQFHHQLWAGYSLSTISSSLKESQTDIQEYINFCQQAKADHSAYTVSRPFYPAFERSIKTPTYKSQEEVCLILEKKDPQKSKFHFNELACALYSNLSKYGTSEKVSVAHRFHNRKALGENRTALFAWLASDAPITLPIDQNRSAMLQSFKSKKSALDAEALAFNMCNAQFPLHQHCPVRFNYIPLLFRKGTADIQFDRYQSTLSFDSRNQMDYMLDFIVRESKNNLEIIVRYSTQEFEGQFISDFIVDWVAELKHYCKSSGDSYKNEYSKILQFNLTPQPITK